jgi:predicted Zn-dependent protease
VDQVRTVGSRIAEAAAIEPLQREINLHLRGYRFEWEFRVLEDDRVNAFCLPGGKVGVFQGLFRVVQNDDQLATVLSHEIAHALAHHASERIARAQMYDRAVAAANGTLGGMGRNDRDTLIGLLAAGAARLRSLSYDRQQEAEADHIGLFLMTFAGYDPGAALRFWERMQEALAGRGRPPEILSDHPSDAHRLEQIRAWIPQAKAAKRAYEERRIAPPAAR